MFIILVSLYVAEQMIRMMQSLNKDGLIHLQSVVDVSFDNSEIGPYVISGDSKPIEFTGLFMDDNFLKASTGITDL